jgi:predicted permease
MSEILATTMQFFVIIGLGAAIRPFIDKHKWIEVLNKYGLFIGFPAIIVTSLTKVKDYSVFDFNIVFANLLILIISIAFILIVTRFTKLSRDIKNTYVICTFFGNVAYLGFPFISGLFPGSSGFISIIVAVYIFIVFTIGVLILDLSKKENSVKIIPIINNLFKNPLLISVLAGVALVILKITIPPVLRNPLEMIASSASPVVLLSLGIFISRKIELNKSFLHGTIISTYKLIVLPLIFVLAFKLFNFSGSAVSISVIEAAMPLAITPFALAEVYPLDKEIVAMTVIISTIFSLFTLVAFSILVR